MAEPNEDLVLKGNGDEKEDGSQSKLTPNLHMSSGKHMAELEKHANFFYAWECFTLSRAKSTVDFVIKDRKNLLALLHVAHHFTQSVRHRLTVDQDRLILRAYKFMRIKMKLSFAAWLRGCTLRRLWL